MLEDGRLLVSFGYSGQEKRLTVVYIMILPARAAVCLPVCQSVFSVFVNLLSMGLSAYVTSAHDSDPPGSPEAPEVKDKTKNSITLSWSPPDKDGGSPIKGYIIEVHEEGCPDWRRVNPADKLHPSTELFVPDLKEGKKCKFRIYAVNAAGNSEPARTAEILTQDILSKCSILKMSTRVVPLVRDCLSFWVQAADVFRSVVKLAVSVLHLLLCVK